MTAETLLRVTGGPFDASQTSGTTDGNNNYKVFPSGQAKTLTLIPAIVSEVRLFLSAHSYLYFFYALLFLSTVLFFLF